ncbi:N-6 DNA methylase [Nonomuraea sp. NPDC050153]|uniref:N-6 DNA methylase n=1 Tax=Nonomuraea sp. NPDC050153 TaxID=3364359 RepID=UPI00378A4587
MSGTRAAVAEGHRLTKVWDAVDGLTGLVSPLVAYHLALRVFFLHGLRKLQEADPAPSWPTWESLIARAGGQGARQPLAQLLSKVRLPEENLQGRSRSTEDIVSLSPSPAAERQLGALVLALDSVDESHDLFEDCLERFSTRYGVRGEYYTARAITELMASMLAPLETDRILDPVCGSGGFLFAAARHVAAGPIAGHSPVLHGLDVNNEARHIAMMRLVLHGLDADIGLGPVDTLHNGLAPSSFDVVLANPPFNMPNWDYNDKLRNHPWAYGPPPKGNANFAWLQRILETLNATGRAGVLLAAGAATGSRVGERLIRQRLLEDDVVAAIVALPGKIFRHTKTAACVWLLSKDKSANSHWGRNPRQEQVLFIDAGRTAERVDGRQHVLSRAGADRIHRTVSAWRGIGTEAYEDQEGWCRSVTLEEIAARNHDLLPTRYVKTIAPKSPSTEIEALTRELYGHFDQATQLERRLRELLEKG